MRYVLKGGWKLRHITKEDLEPLWTQRGVSVRKMAGLLGCSSSALSRKAQRLGLPPKVTHTGYSKKVSNEKLRSLLEEGFSVTQIADAYGYKSNVAIYKRMKRLEIPTPRMASQ